MEKDTGRLFDDNPESPGEALRRHLDAKGWTQDELAVVTGRPRPAITEVVTGKRGITPEMAVALAAALGTSADYWLRLDSAYRLSQLSDEGPADIRRRAKLFELAPIKDMQKRGWIVLGKSLVDTEKELIRFYHVESLDEAPSFPVAARKADPLADLTPAQRAWCFRLRQLAHALQVDHFHSGTLPALKADLRRMAAYPNDARKVPEVMRTYGIRFVVIEPLPGMKMDGVAFWLDENSPVIGLSTRLDRVDNFWFTLMHEVAHIEHGDAISVDANLSGEDEVPSLMKSDVERKADDAAAASLIPTDELQSFIRRTGPIYSKQNIIQFAHRIKIHPGIIVGQLQRRGEVGWHTHREMLPKIRSHITSTALTDGWGHSISPGTV